MPAARIVELLHWPVEAVSVFVQKARLVTFVATGSHMTALENCFECGRRNYGSSRCFAQVNAPILLAQELLTVVTLVGTALAVRVHEQGSQIIHCENGLPEIESEAQTRVVVARIDPRPVLKNTDCNLPAAW